MKRLFLIVLICHAVQVYGVEAKPASASPKGPTCFDSGKTRHLISGNDGFTTRFSQDGKAAVLAGHESDKVQIIDLETGTSKEFSKPSGAWVDALRSGKFAFSDLSGLGETETDASKVVNLLKKAKTTILDPSSGKTTTVIGKIAVMWGQLYTPVGVKGKHTVLLKGEDGSSREFNLNEGGDDGAWSRYASDLNDPEVKYDPKAKTVTFSKDGKDLYKAKLPTLGTNSGADGSFSLDKSLFVGSEPRNDTNGSTDAPNKAMVFDLRSKTTRTFLLPEKYELQNTLGSARTRFLSKDSNKVLLRSNTYPSEGVKVLDLTTGKAESVLDKKSIRDVYFDDSDHICGAPDGFGGKSIECYDPKSGKLSRTIRFPFEVGSVSQLSQDKFLINNYGGNGQESQTYVFHHRTTCPKEAVRVECDCLNKKVPRTKEIELIKDAAVVVVCGQAFSEQLWNSLTPAKSNVIDEKAALLWLKRFSKPGGFLPDEHTSILAGMMSAGLQSAYPAEVKAALNGVLVSSDQLYESMLEKYPDLKSLKEKPNTKCLTKDELAKIEKTAFDYAKTRILAARRPTFSDLNSLGSIVRDNLDEAKRKELAELAADQLVITAGDSQELNQIFSSKIYKFSENKMKNAFGLPHKDLTDVTVARSGGELVFYQLGVSGFPGATETKIGMAIKEVDRVAAAKLPDKSVKNFEWQYGGKQYSTDVALNKQSLEKKIISDAKAPNYKEMWQGKTFRGVVVAGANMGAGLSNTVMKEYIEYYTQQGFKFDEAKPIANMTDYLKEKVSGKEPMHYFVKEAHSDGDEKNLFRVSEQGKLLLGTKKVGDKTEIVELIYPATGATKLLRNSEFGEWMRDREKNKQPELVYFNSSCWSVGKAIFEIPAAMTSKLINIPTTTSMTTFTNQEKNVMRAAVDGVRNQKTYAQIREDMKKDSKYESRSDNVMIFPDEDDYKSKITEALRVPVEVDIRLFVKGADGKRSPYSIEESQ